MPQSVYATEEVTKAPSWHGLVAVDMFLNNLTTGLYLVAALCELAAPGAFAPLARVAYPVALAILLVDLLCLVADLGDPLRFHHMLRVFKPGAPMSLGTWFLTSYALVLTPVVAIDLLRAFHLLPRGWAVLEWARKLAVAVGLVPALGSVVYKGVLFSTSSQPGWKDARWLGAYLVNSALLLGCAGMIVLAYLTGHPRPADVLRPAFAVLLALNLIPLGLLIEDVRADLARVYGRGRLTRLGILTIGGGILLPLCLVLIGRGPVPMLAAVTCCLLGKLAIRFLIIRIPHAFHEDARRRTGAGGGTTGDAARNTRSPAEAL